MRVVECSMCGAEEFGSARPTGWHIEPGGNLCPSCAAVSQASSQGSVANSSESVGFERPEPGSRERYIARRKVRPWTAHTFWWFVHNAIAHPLIAIAPVKLFFRFHDWTSYRMHGKRGP